MSFDSGSVSFRLFYLTRSYDSGLVDAFARHAAPPLASLNRDPISGWVTGRHLLDREISDEKCVFGPYLYAMHMKAEKKVPESLLRTHCRLEEDAELRARGVESLPRTVRAEIKQRMIETLLPTMPPTLSGIPVVVDFRNDLLIAGAVSDKQIDTLSPVFKETAGSLPILLTPDTAALRRKQINANNLNPVSFSPDDTIDPPAESTLGMDFFTWLWFAWETEGGVYHLPDGREFGVMLEGPLTFFREGQGAHEAVLRKGTPINSREAATALLCGKKLKRAKVVIGQGDNVLSATMDADFAFRSLKLPKGEQQDPVGRFQERMCQIETFWCAWLSLYDRFLDLRTDAGQWPKTLNAIKQWIGHIGERAAAAIQA